MSHPAPLDRILREQRAAAATLPAPGGVLGLSDWLAEEVLLRSESAAGPEPAIAGEDGGWLSKLKA